MKWTISDYSALMRVRHMIFPTFDVDQKQAAREICEGVKAEIHARNIDCVIELGCGTAEVLDGVRRNVEESEHRAIKAIGVDCCGKEIEIANATYERCTFHEQRAEVFMKTLVRNRGRLESARSMMLCVGHTIPHFYDVPSFLDDVAEWRPGIVVVDWHDGWDHVVEHFGRANAQPMREAKRYPTKEHGSETVYTLTTKSNPDESERVLRGIEEIRDGQVLEVPIMTTQLRKPRSWFLAELEQRGFRLAKRIDYNSGYGKMNAVVVCPAERQ